MILKILSLSKWQKMLCLPKVWYQEIIECVTIQPFAFRKIKMSEYSVTQKPSQEIKHMPHWSSTSNQGTSRRLKSIVHYPSWQEAKIQKRDNLENICGYGISLLEWIPVKSMEDPQSSWEIYFSKNIPSLGWKREGTKGKEAVKSPKFCWQEAGW